MERMKRVEITFNGAEFELEQYTHAKPEEIQRYWAPRTCAHCRYSIAVEPEDGKILPYDSGRFAQVNAFRCPKCKKAFLVVSEIDGAKDPVLKAFIPVFSPVVTYPGLDRMSPAFSKIHQEAYRAFQMGMYRIAGLGFRTALEILLKDFAISELKAAEEKVAPMKLNDVIKEYYKQMDSDDLARGVQLLGNDCTHYINKHEDVSPETIETFYRYFATLLNAKYESRHLNDGKR